MRSEPADRCRAIGGSVQFVRARREFNSLTGQGKPVNGDGKLQVDRRGSICFGRENVDSGTGIFGGRNPIAARMDHLENASPGRKCFTQNPEIVGQGNVLRLKKIVVLLREPIGPVVGNENRSGFVAKHVADLRSGSANEALHVQAVEIPQVMNAGPGRDHAYAVIDGVLGGIRHCLGQIHQHQLPVVPVIKVPPSGSSKRKQMHEQDKRYRERDKIGTEPKFIPKLKGVFEGKEESERDQQENVVRERGGIGEEGSHGACEQQELGQVSAPGDGPSLLPPKFVKAGDACGGG